jgi:hypothetical protein
MDKQTKLYIGIGLLGVGAYLYWKSQQPKANAIGAKTEPKEYTACRRACANSLDYTACMGQCLDKSTSTLSKANATGNKISPSTSVLCPACKNGKCYDDMKGQVVSCGGSSIISNF